jgi:hypothetical protein
MDELEELIECAEREDNLVDVNPFITAIRIDYGPRESARVFSEWCRKRGIRTGKV